MHDIKELSTILGISDTAAYNWANDKRLKNYVFKQNGKKYIKPEGIEIIKGFKESVDKVEINIENKILNDKGNPDNNNVLNTLSNLVSKLDEKEEHIKKLEIQIEDIKKDKEKQIDDMRKDKDRLITELEKDKIYFQGLLQQSVTEKQLLLENQKPWWKKLLKN